MLQLLNSCLLSPRPAALLHVRRRTTDATIVAVRQGSFHLCNTFIMNALRSMKPVWRAERLRGRHVSNEIATHQGNIGGAIFSLYFRRAHCFRSLLVRLFRQNSPNRCSSVTSAAHLQERRAIGKVGSNRRITGHCSWMK
jgi:hypothetical protein